MFTIIISEKGGAERRESYDKSEINVGRVQGNDLMLPKGNVSKHHARLLYREGRFIVTDLKSTNGTYVNGRKISQATIVREGDKIYIGDFVLRLDTGVAASSTVDPEALRDDEPPRQAPPPLGRASGGPGFEPRAQEEGDTSTSAVAAIGMQQERGGAPPRVPPAPRVPSAIPLVPPGAGTASPAQRTALMHGNAAPAAQRPPVVRQPPAPVVAQPPPAPAPEVRVPSRLPPRESPQQAARRLALITLVDRVAEAVNLAPLKASPIVEDHLIQEIERVIRDQVRAMKDEGETPEGTDGEVLVRDALSELVDLGPLGPLLEDEDVAEIHVLRPDQVLTVRGGAPTLAETSFTSDTALERVVQRLVFQSGQPLAVGEHLIERRLVRGSTLLATTSPASTGTSLVILKRRRVDGSLEELIRGHVLSRPMALFMESCIGARANMLVCGPMVSTTSQIVGALAALSAPGERVAVLFDEADLALVQTHAVTMAVPDYGAGGEAAVRAAARMRVERMIAGPLSGAFGVAVLEAATGGCEGVVAAMVAPSLRQGLSRLGALYAATRAGVTSEAARECVGECFDVGIELGRGADGRVRIVRIAELSGSDGKAVVSRDLFTLSEVGPAGEAAFVATGVVPRFVGEFASRGVRVDANLFRRASGR